MSNSIRWIPRDSTFRLLQYRKRIITGDEEKLIVLPRKDTVFDFKIEDLAPENTKQKPLRFLNLTPLLKKNVRVAPALPMLIYWFVISVGVFRFCLCVNHYCCGHDLLQAPRRNRSEPRLGGSSSVFIYFLR